MQMVGYFGSAIAGFREHRWCECSDHWILSLLNVGMQRVILKENMWTYIVWHVESKGAYKQCERLKNRYELRSPNNTSRSPLLRRKKSSTSPGGHFLRNRDDATRSNQSPSIPSTLSLSSTAINICLYNASSSPKGISRAWRGGRIPSTTFRRSAGWWRIDETYFTTVDAYMNWPEDFLTSRSITSMEGHESSR